MGLESLLGSEGTVDRMDRNHLFCCCICGMDSLGIINPRHWVRMCLDYSSASRCWANVVVLKILLSVVVLKLYWLMALVLYNYQSLLVEEPVKAMVSFDSPLTLPDMFFLGYNSRCSMGSILVPRMNCWSLNLHQNNYQPRLRRRSDPLAWWWWWCCCCCDRCFRTNQGDVCEADHNDKSSQCVWRWTWTKQNYICPVW